MDELIFDGAFGTYYCEKTNDDGCCERANLHSPSIVALIHKEYIAAGCRAIKTNTFACGNIAESDEELRELLGAGYRIACEAAKESNAEVFCDTGDLESDDCEDRYVQITKLFASFGAKSFLFETQSDYAPLVKALRYIRSELPDAKVIVSFAVAQSGTTRRGKSCASLLGQAYSDGLVYAAGLNCVCGPAHLTQLVSSLDLKGKHFSAMPNGGYPGSVNGRTEYRATPDYFASGLVGLRDLGADILGGCCGTTPLHIRRAVAALNASKPSSDASGSRTEEKLAPQRVFNPIREMLRLGKKLIAVELDPPADADADFIVNASKRLGSAGADAITLADSPLARARADSFVLAQKVKRESGIEAIPHLSCRDRNHIGLRGTLLAGSIEGLTNVIAVTGDAIAGAGRADRGVFECSSFELISMIAEMNASPLLGREYMISCALNVNALNFDAELRRALRKRDAGAEVFFTQPIYTSAAIENALRAQRELERPVMAGIMPPASYKNALFLSNEVPGVEIPQNVLDALRDKTGEEAFAVSSDFAMSVIEKLYDGVSGFYLVTPLKKTELIVKLIEKIRFKGNEGKAENDYNG